MTEQAELFPLRPEAPLRSALAVVPVVDIRQDQTPAPGWLYDDIKHNGIMEPVVLADMGDDGYEVIEGRKRVAAARALGLEKIPANVYDHDDIRPWKAARAVALNELRAANPVTNFESVTSMAFAGIKEEQISRATGLTLPTVRAILSLTSVHTDIVAAFTAGKVKFSVLRLVGRTARQSQLRLLGILADTGTLTARDVRENCPEFKAGPVQTVTVDEWLEGAYEALQTLEDTATNEVPLDILADVQGLASKLGKVLKAKAA